jgi:hypothetical protein
MQPEVVCSQGAPSLHQASDERSALFNSFNGPHVLRMPMLSGQQLSVQPQREYDG